MEHRWGQRHEIDRIVRLRTRGGLVARARITSVSISGAFVVSPLPVVLLSYVRIQFTGMRDGGKISVAAEGQVVRRDAIGFAVEWREFAPAAVCAFLLEPPGWLPASSRTMPPHPP
ncbi:MAG: PilZ domain-containing protein [Steroidobacteraceae bacterium]